MEIIETDQDPYISDGSAANSFGVGWQLLKSSFWIFLAIIVIYIILDTVPDLVKADNETSLLSWALSLFITGPISMSVAWVFLKAARRESYQLSDMFAVFKRNYWSAVGGYILKALIILIGLLFLIVPGFILAIRLSFVELLIIDEKMDPIEAIRESWDRTHGHGMTLFGMFVLSILTILLGLLCLGVGILVSMVWIYATYAVFYLTVAGNQPEELEVYE